MPYRQNQKTGEWWETDAQGNPIRPANAGNRPPADPAFPYKGQKAAADVNSTQVNTQGQAIDNRVKSASADALIRQAQADADKAANDAVVAKAQADMRGAGRPELNGAQFSDAIAQYNAAQQIDIMLKDLRDKFEKGPGATSGVRGLQDLIPWTEGNQRFNKASDRFRSWVKQGTGTTGGENNTVSEMKLRVWPANPEPRPSSGLAAFRMPTGGLRLWNSPLTAWAGFPLMIRASRWPQLMSTIRTAVCRNSPLLARGSPRRKATGRITPQRT
jgi:hypothetical protein